MELCTLLKSISDNIIVSVNLKNIEPTPTISTIASTINAPSKTLIKNKSTRFKPNEIYEESFLKKSYFDANFINDNNLNDNITKKTEKKTNKPDPSTTLLLCQVSSSTISSRVCNPSTSTNSPKNTALKNNSISTFNTSPKPLANQKQKLNENSISITTSSIWIPVDYQLPVSITSSSPVITTSNPTDEIDLIQNCYKQLRLLVPTANEHEREMTSLQLLQHVIDYIMDLEELTSEELDSDSFSSGTGDLVLRSFSDSDSEQEMDLKNKLNNIDKKEWEC